MKVLKNYKIYNECIGRSTYRYKRRNTVFSIIYKESRIKSEEGLGSTDFIKEEIGRTERIEIE